MNKRIGILVGCGFLARPCSPVVSRSRRGRAAATANGQAGDDTVTRMMEFDANKDGKLTREEVTDERLTRLFDRADADKDGTVTTGRADRPRRRGAGPAGRSRRLWSGRIRPPPGGGPPGGGFRPGEILPQMFQSRLNLSAEQKTQIEALQKDVDAGLEKIFNDEQKSAVEGDAAAEDLAVPAAVVRADAADRAGPAVVVQEVLAAARPIAPSDEVQPRARGCRLSTLRTSGPPAS